MIRLKTLIPISSSPVSGLCLAMLCLVLSQRVQGGTADSLDQRIDAAVHRRDELVSAYTVSEHYALFRGKDEEHPAADMTVKTTYLRQSGKSYAIVSESGSELMRKVLESVLNNEKRMTEPANRIAAVITSANYEMTQKGLVTLNGRDCLMVGIKPRRSSPYLFDGTIWVDAQNASIIQLQGTAVKAPSMLTGATQVYRQYMMMDGIPMATHATAVSNSWILGQITIKIDYANYEIQKAGGQVSDSFSKPQ